MSISDAMEMTLNKILQMLKACCHHVFRNFKSTKIAFK